MHRLDLLIVAGIGTTLATLPVVAENETLQAQKPPTISESCADEYWIIGHYTGKDSVDTRYHYQWLIGYTHYGSSNHRSSG